MADKHFVIIGNGPAGNQAAFTLRERAPDSRITVISKGRGNCYSPHLLPDFIAGKIKEEDLYVSESGAYKASDIKLRCCQEVVGLRLEAKEVILEHKEIIPFDGLIIAVGGRPHIPEQVTHFQGKMLTLQTLEDAKVWIDKLGQINSVLMIGGDLSSLAATKALIHLQKKVYFVLNEDAFWPLRWSEDLFNAVADKLAEIGVEVFVRHNLKSISEPVGGNYDVEVNGEIIHVGMIGAFFGYVPDITFLASSGLHVDRGVLVDEYLHTGFAGVYATGDCAQIYHPEISDYWISVGHENAAILGRAAAINLVGGEAKAKVEPESIFTMKGINVNTSWWVEF